MKSRVIPATPVGKISAGGIKVMKVRLKLNKIIQSPNQTDNNREFQFLG